MATATKAPSGLILRGDTWHMRFSVKGVLVAESTFTTSRRAAERILATRRAELVEQLVLGKLKPIKLHTAIDEFLRSRAQLPSYKNAKMHLDLFRALPNHTLDKITDHQLLTIIEERFAAGKAKSTVGVTVNYFNALINYCATKEYTVRKKMKTIKGVKGRIRWLTDEEEARFFAAIDPKAEYHGKNLVSDAQKQENWDLAKLLSHTGARYTEIADMNWSQVDLINQTVVIKRGKDGIDSTMHMTRTMREIFERRRIMEKGDYVIGSKVGKHNETKWVHAAVKRAGLSTVDGSISLHTLRHSRAVKWLHAGMNPMEVQQMLGHRSLQATLVYLHLLPNDTAKKAAALTEPD